MEKVILLDKYNKKYEFYNKKDLLEYGESLSSPIFLKLDLDIDYNLLAYHFIVLEYIMIIIDDNKINIYLCDRVDNNRIDFINKLSSNYKYKDIKYNLAMSDGTLSFKEIVGEKEFKNLMCKII